MVVQTTYRDIWIQRKRGLTFHKIAQMIGIDTDEVKRRYVFFDTGVSKKDKE